MSGNEEATLGDVTIKAQKKMVELIDSLASLPQPQRLVMEASGKLDKLRDITRQYSQSKVVALKYIEEHVFFQNGPAECSLFESKIPVAWLAFFDTICFQSDLRRLAGDESDVPLKEACEQKLAECDSNPLPSLPVLKKKLIEFFPLWQTMPPFPVNPDFAAAMKAAFGEKPDFAPMVDLIDKDWLACESVEDLCNPYRKGATVTLCVQVCARNDAQPVDHIEYMLMCHWSPTGYGIAALPSALPIIIAEKLSTWVKLKRFECDLSVIFVGKKKVKYAASNLRLGDMNNKTIKEKTTQTGREIAAMKVPGKHAVEVTEYSDDIETRKVMLNSSKKRKRDT